MARIPSSGSFGMSDINAEFNLGNALSANRGQYHDEWPCKFPATTIGYNDFRGKARIPAPSPIESSIRQDPNRIYQLSFFGTRSPADKVSNYVIVPPDLPQLTLGKKYSYVLTTSADQYGFRNLADGTQIRSWGYNGSYPAAEDKVTYQGWKDNGIPYNPEFSSGGLGSVGTFTYIPTNITGGDGSTAFGKLIARNTYGVSDAGKGTGTLTVFEVCYMFRLCETYGIPFPDNNL